MVSREPRFGEAVRSWPPVKLISGERDTIIVCLLGLLQMLIERTFNADCVPSARSGDLGSACSQLAAPCLGYLTPCSKFKDRGRFVRHKHSQHADLTSSVHAFRDGHLAWSLDFKDSGQHVDFHRFGKFLRHQVRKRRERMRVDDEGWEKENGRCRRIVI